MKQHNFVASKKVTSNVDIYKIIYHNGYKH